MAKNESISRAKELDPSHTKRGLAVGCGSFFGFFGGGGGGGGVEGGGEEESNVVAGVDLHDFSSGHWEIVLVHSSIRVLDY